MFTIRYFKKQIRELSFFMIPKLWLKYIFLLMLLGLFPFYCIQYTLLWARKMTLELHENQQSISWDYWSLRNPVSFSQGMSFSQLPTLPEVSNQVPSSPSHDLTPNLSRGGSLTTAGRGTGFSGGAREKRVAGRAVFPLIQGRSTFLPEVDSGVQMYAHKHIR